MKKKFNLEYRVAIRYVQYVKRGNKENTETYSQSTKMEIKSINKLK